MKTTPLFILFFLVIFACCKKENPPTDNTPQLPPETQTGANTFGCLVNGQVWLPKGGGLLQTISRSYEYPIMNIQANKAKDDETIQLSFINIYSQGNYLINDSISSQIVFYNIENIWYFCDTIVSGLLTITRLDTINKIVSGTFYFDAVNDSVRHEIRSGRFDVKY